MRRFAHRLAGILRVVPAAIHKGGGVRGMLGRVALIYRRHGWSGLKTSLGLLVRGEGPARMADAGTLNRSDYAQWLQRYGQLTAEDRAAMARRIAKMSAPPVISVLMPVYSDNTAMLREAIESVRGQIYPHWQLCIADDASPSEEARSLLARIAREDARIQVVLRPRNGHICAASNSALELVTGDWVALLDHDDLLSEHALYCLAEAILANPEAQLIYSDEDKVDEHGVRSAPYFKPGWNWELIRSQNYFSHLGAFRTGLVRAVGGFRLGLEGAQDHDLVLRCAERVNSASQIVHIPRVLYHWRIHAASTADSLQAKPYALQAGVRALDEHFVRMGIHARAEATSSGFRIRYTLPEPPPLVSLIIPTRNAVQLVRQCIQSIEAKTRYANYEILLVDNGSDDPEALAYFKCLQDADPRVRVLRDDSPFNYAALNNAAVEQASGELVALVNNDIEIITAQWLDELVGIALQPGVGAVGARLWYPNKTLQHGGVILGIGGVAGHAHKYLPEGGKGYFMRAVLAQSLSAVTAACLVIRKATYQAVGGLDAENLKVAFNDVDFCLRVREAGYRNVWTPHAELFHHESATRGEDVAPEKRARFQAEVEYMMRRWGSALEDDPAYSPNLTLQFEDFSYAWPPRVPPLA